MWRRLKRIWMLIFTALVIMGCKAGMREAATIEPTVLVQEKPSPTPSSTPTVLATEGPGEMPASVSTPLAQSTRDMLSVRTMSKVTPTPKRERRSFTGYYNPPSVYDLDWLVLLYNAVFIGEVEKIYPRRWANPENRPPEGYGQPGTRWNPEKGGYPFQPVEIRVIEWLKRPQLVLPKDPKARQLWLESQEKNLDLEMMAFMYENPPEKVLLEPYQADWYEKRIGKRFLFRCIGPYKTVSGDWVGYTFVTFDPFPVTEEGNVVDVYGNAIPLEEAKEMVRQTLEKSP